MDAGFVVDFDLEGIVNPIMIIVFDLYFDLYAVLCESLTDDDAHSLGESPAGVGPSAWSALASARGSSWRHGAAHRLRAWPL